VQLLGDHVLRDDRVRLEGVSAPLAGEGDRGAGQRPAHAALAEPRTDEEARHRPDGVVGLVLVATVPRDAEDAQQTFVFGARLDRTPPDGFAVEVRNEPARGV
jgi:hypothetical protein